MSFELAQEIIQKEFAFTKESSDFDEIEFDFMGGEPFVKFDLMKEIMEWTWSQKWPVPYIFFTTTNGTLLDAKIKHWLWCHRKIFFVGISYDGTKQMQNTNRSRSASTVDLDFFLATYPEQGVKMTISPSTLKSLAEGVAYLHSVNCKISANCGYGLKWSADDKNEFRWQLMQLANYYLEHPAIEPISFFEPKLHHILAPHDQNRKWCGTGTNMITYDTDGETYPCHLFTPMVLGTKKAAKLHIKMDFSASSNNLCATCASCSLVNICPTCYGFNYMATGDISCREKEMCELFKIQIDVYAYFLEEKLRRQKKSQIPFSPKEIQEANALLFLLENPPKTQQSSTIQLLQK